MAMDLRQELSGVQRFLATGNARCAGTHHFKNGVFLDRVQKVVQLLATTGQLDGVSRIGHIENMPVKYLRQPFHFSPLFALSLIHI